jgi:hypothetical protein
MTSTTPTSNAEAIKHYNDVNEQLTNAYATKAKSEADAAKAKAKEQELKNKALKAEQARKEAKEAERQASRLEKKFVVAKQEFLAAQDRDAQRAALKKLSQFPSGQEYVLDVLYRSDAIEPKLKLQALHDLLEPVHRLPQEHYREAMGMLPTAIYDHTEGKDAFVPKTGSVEAPTGLADKANDFKQRLEALGEKSQHKKPTKAQWKQLKEMERWILQLDTAPLRYEQKSTLAAQALKQIVDKDVLWFDTTHSVNSFFVNRRALFEQTVQKLLRHI